jgi:hypothetical protein
MEDEGLRVIDSDNAQNLKTLQDTASDAYRKLRTYIGSHKEELIDQLRRTFPNKLGANDLVEFTIAPHGSVYTQDYRFWYREGKWSTLTGE